MLIDPMKKIFSTFALATLFAALVACDSLPECEKGEVRFDGRPPRTMFAFDRTCRDNCFSYPASDASCDPSCPEIVLDRPTGVLIEDRHLLLADAKSLGASRALVFGFGFVDEAGGDAPSDWGITRSGSRTYLNDQVVGTARFVMDTGVAEVAINVFDDDDSDLLATRTTAEAALVAQPGRLEFLEANDGRLRGRFLLGYQTSTHQAQGEVVGCFDVSLSEERELDGVSYRVIQ
ncbi:MAG: hypothetical protein A2289_23125 [Deltaproteobacteria bacterium RIFOXYA12_FULL_58_15]|nr:MAG: hypothetical protein A2289_23125 [Deltaproteobacteria bacterium RIFOXYA12_FULL_58_15]OGR11563.1 MAG: hypothetical protein A2341_20390 [Deltaproteobacteria bacterium RIFOXYB12_FULL_58_9]